MRIAEAALILVFLLSTTICKGEENRDQEAEEDPATENFYLELLQVLGILVPLAVLLGTFGYYYFGMDGMAAMLVFLRTAVWLYVRMSELE